jgi:hypothetical protein
MSELKFAVVWALYGLACAGAGAGLLWLRQDVRSLPPPVVDFKRLDEIDMRLRSLEGLRCVTIKAEKFDLTIYPVTSLGKAKP